MNVTVIGCGHGGCALAAHLSQLGQTVTLYADQDHPGYMKSIKGNIIRLEGEIQGEVRVYRLTTDLELAISTAEIIYIVLPTGAHITQFKKMTPYLKSGQIILTLAGSFSSVYFYQELKQYNMEDSVYIADLSSLPYACRMNQNGSAHIIAVKNSINISAMPSNTTSIVIDRIKQYFPTKLVSCMHVLELGLNDVNAICHPTVALLNAGRIGNNQPEFYFYKEGITPEIALIIQQLDIDRQEIGALYGLNVPKFLDITNTFYGSNYKSIFEFFKQSIVHNKQKLCPHSTNHRYLSQDIPNVMLPWYSLGRQAGYESVVMRSVIDLASILNNKDYYQDGRSIVEDLFSGMSPQQINEYVSNGHYTNEINYFGAA